MTHRIRLSVSQSCLLLTWSILGPQSHRKENQSGPIDLGITAGEKENLRSFLMIEY